MEEDQITKACEAYQPLAHTSSQFTHIHIRHDALFDASLSCLPACPSHPFVAPAFHRPPASSRMLSHSRFLALQFKFFTYMCLQFLDKRRFDEATAIRDAEIEISMARAISSSGLVCSNKHSDILLEIPDRLSFHRYALAYNSVPTSLSAASQSSPSSGWEYDRPGIGAVSVASACAHTHCRRRNADTE